MIWVCWPNTAPTVTGVECCLPFFTTVTLVLPLVFLTAAVGTVNTFCSCLTMIETSHSNPHRPPRPCR